MYGQLLRDRIVPVSGRTQGVARAAVREGASVVVTGRRERAANDLPMGKLAQVDEIADFVVFLLSSRSGVVTGSVIDRDQHVFGGMG